MLEKSQNDTDPLLSTMVGPLYSRAKYSELYPDLFSDNQAKILMTKVREMFPDSDEAFQRMEQFVDELVGLGLVIRAKMFDDAIGVYIQNKPNATIINLGCGLDTSFSRVDNGTIHWIDLDLPVAIDFRLQLIPQTERCRYISKSVFDYSWIDETIVDDSNGVFIFAGGLFTYFENSKVSELVSLLASKFPRGEMMFDCGSSRGNWLMNRRLRRLGVIGADHIFEVNRYHDVESWSDRIRVLEYFSYFSKVKIDPRWNRLTRIMVKLNSWLKLEKFIHLQFL